MNAATKFNIVMTRVIPSQNENDRICTVEVTVQLRSFLELSFTYLTRARFLARFRITSQ